METISLFCNREAILAEITRAYAAHAEAHLRADPDGAAANLAQDAVTYWEGGHETHGRKAQRDFYAELYKTMIIKSLEYTTEELDVCGSRAYELGSYTMSFETGGSLTTGRYRYMAVWERQADGAWKVFRAIGHSVESQTA